MIEAVEPAGLSPMTHAADRLLRLRAIADTEPDTSHAAQRSGQAVAEGLYLVPRVIE